MKLKYLFYFSWGVLYAIWVTYCAVTKSKSSVKKKARPGIHFFIYTPGLFVIILWQGKPFVDSAFLKCAGIVILSLGVLIAIWARLILGNNWSGRIVILENQKLIKYSIYRYIRHPVYLGFCLAFLGSFIYLFSLTSFIAATAVITSFQFKIRQEEQALIDEFGEEYLQYIKETKKIIPLVY